MRLHGLALIGFVFSSSTVVWAKSLDDLLKSSDALSAPAYCAPHSTQGTQEDADALFDIYINILRIPEIAIPEESFEYGVNTEETFCGRSRQKILTMAKDIQRLAGVLASSQGFANVRSGDAGPSLHN